LTFSTENFQAKKSSTLQLNNSTHFPRMSMIAFYNINGPFYYINGREPVLASEYELADPIEDDRPNLDIIFPSQDEIVKELPKYIAYKGKKAPKQLNYGKVLADIFKDVYDIAEEKEAIEQKNCRKNLKFIKYLPHYVAEEDLVN